MNRRPLYPFCSKVSDKRPPLPLISTSRKFYLTRAQRSSRASKRAVLYEYASGQCSSSEPLLCTSPQDFFLAAARELLACTRVSSRRAARSLQLTIARSIIADSSGVQRETQRALFLELQLVLYISNFRAHLH